ncbi:MAG: hypothetical protein SFU86_22650 [Pirellulaceae bacterium]|nr:hypothetical protein [Pirellulaceae bacterium]
MRRILCLSPLVAILMAWADSARGEVFLLKSGGRIEAEQLNPQRAAGDPYQVRTPLGVRLDLAPAQVARVIVKTDAQKQYDDLLPSVANTAAAHWEMAEWCKEAELLDARKRHLAAIIALEPDHEAARLALGYSRYGTKWMTQDEYMTSLGYIRNGGRWRLQQEIELDLAEKQRVSAEKAHRTQIRKWFDQLGGRLGGEALAGLQMLRDPLAAPALAEIIADAKQPASNRLMCLDILSKMPAGLANEMLMTLAMDETNDNLRDRALAELRRSQSVAAELYFVSQLKSKDNKRVNRAALCLQGIGAQDATLSLINALVTQHTYLVTTSNGGGGGSGGGTPISFGSGGPGGGLGGLSMGGKPQKVKVDHKNELVHSALRSLNPGVDYSFDRDAWKRWYIENFTSTNVDLRRGE